MDEVARLTVLSEKLKVQLENQKLRLEEQGKEIVTTRQQIAFYRGENIDMRRKIRSWNVILELLIQAAMSIYYRVTKIT